jgi:putative ubiquitin-RnfH superfamily antitoxin RatB of RatAB toxin-antitoxin module
MANPESTATEQITVEVAYALPERQRIISFKVNKGCTALEAVRQSGIVVDFPEIDPESADMGIFAKNLDGKAMPLPGEYELRERDRVEIYRPLQADPKEARAKRAARAKAAKSDGADESED